MPLISDGYGNQPPPLGFAESPEHYQQKLAMWQQAQGNRGSGQPINQPMGPPIGYAEKPEDYQRRLASVGQQNPMLMPAGTGSLQSLGGGQLNQSGMVTLRGTDGTTKAVPQQDLAHWLSKGAVRV
jgi:hypothetical protein